MISSNTSKIILISSICSFGLLSQGDARIFGTEKKKVNELQNPFIMDEQNHSIAFKRHLGEMTLLGNTDNIFNQNTTTTSSSTTTTTSIKESHIVGGFEVDSPSNYPFLVSILTVDFWTQYAMHGCAGTLIAPDVVLTAAHCVDYSATWIVDTGRFSWRDDENVEPFRVVEVYQHPEFYSNFFFNDVALLKLSGKATATPVKLQKGSFDIEVGDEVSIIGWGLTTDNGNPSPDLLEARVSVISENDCELFYGNYLSKSMVCAYGFNKDACQGDSGGPALSLDGGEVTQIGITSWGIGCGENPGVYTRLDVPEVMDFINEYMCNKLSPESCKDGLFYGTAKYDDFTSSTSSDQQDDSSSSSITFGIDKCKNSDPFSCIVVAQSPWLGCFFSYNECPETCCPDSCDPNQGCV